MQDYSQDSRSGGQRISRFGNEEVIVKSMLIMETGSFFDIYNRPFEMNLTDQSRESIRKRLDGVGPGSVNEKSFKGMASGILAPVAEVDHRRDLIQIPDGWDRPRMRFMLHVVVNSRTGAEDEYYLQGFSDHLGVTYNGTRGATIDPDMRLYINGFIRVQEVHRSTMRGTERVAVVKQSAQIINGRIIYDDTTPVTKTRTVDLFSNMQERMVADDYRDELKDDRARLTSPSDAIFANRKDNLPGMYLSSALDTYRRNTELSAFGVDNRDVLSRTQSELSAELVNLEDNAFLRILAGVRGEYNSTCFTIKDLIDIDPDVMRNGVINSPQLDNSARRGLAHTEGDVSDWRGADLESRWAQQIANFTSAIMMSNYHRALDATFTNQNIDGRIVDVVHNAEALAGNMPEEIFERMIDTLVDAFEDLSDCNRIDFRVSIRCNLYNQAEIFVSLYGNPEQRFFVPTFADGLMSPFYSRDPHALSRLSSDLESLISDVSGELVGSSRELARGM